MDDDEERCDVQGPNGMGCTLPKDHGGDSHAYEIELPPHIAQVIANYIDHLEKSSDEIDKQLRRMRHIRWFLYGAAGLNVGAALYYLVLILGQP